MRTAVLIVIGLIIGMAPLGQNKKTKSERNKPPTITSFTSDVETIPYCPFLPVACTNVDRKVRLSTTVQDSEKRSFTYSYAVSAGKIEGEGSSVLWDLTSAGFGEHTVKVLVGNAKHERATASLTVSIVECGICDAPRDLCPTISVECPSEVERGKVITFVATVTSFGKPNTTYSWATDAGRIVEGRYEKKMTLDLLRFPFEKVTATVTVGGYDPSCPTSASCTTKIRE